MADDPDLETLAEAFAALERSRKRLDVLIEREARKGPRAEARTVSDLLDELEPGAAPRSDIERRILIDYTHSRLSRSDEAANCDR